MNIKDMALDELKKLYARANKVYNNDPNGKLVMTDDEFDALERKIRKVDHAWTGLRATGAPVNKKVEVRLPHFMPSLAKIYPEKLEKWRAKQKTKLWLMMQKLDGSALIGTYRKGRCVFLATRGDGTLGKDISFLIPFLNLPAVKEKSEFSLRFEAVVLNKVWAKKWKSDFDNPRQMANGLLNRRTEHPGMKDICLVVLGVYDKPLMAGFKWALDQGFTVVVHRIVKLGDDFAELLAAERGQAETDIDGLVLAPPEAVFQYSSADRPKWTVAIKVNDESGAVLATVSKIIWQVSRTGRWTPKIYIEPMRIGSVMVKNCTAHNAQWMNDRGIGVGAVVKLVRAGDVIPKIVGVQTRAKKLSVPDGAYTLQGVHYVESERSRDADVREIHHFFATLGIEHIAAKTVAKLYDGGFTSVLHHLKSYGIRMTGYTEAGMGRAMTGKIYGECSRVFHDEGVTILKLMNASNCFESFGERKLQMIENHYRDHLGDPNALATYVKSPMAFLMNEKNWVSVTSIKGVGDASARQFFEGVMRFKMWLSPILKTKLIKINKPEAPIKKKKVGGDLAGQFVTFTGYRDLTHEQAVTDRGAEVVSFGSKTTILIYKQGGKMSTKLDKARDKGVRVLTFKEL